MTLEVNLKQSDLCEINNACKHKECDYITYVSEFLNEDYIGFTCPDKEERYLSLTDRGKEVDLLLKSPSSELAIETKRIVLGNRAEQADTNRLISMITDKLGQEQHTIFLNVKKGLRPKWNDIERFIDNYVSIGSESKYSNKYVDIRFQKNLLKIKDAGTNDMETIWNTAEPQGELSSTQVVSLIMSTNEGALNFVVDFSKPMKLDSYIYFGKETIEKMNKKIRADKAKFSEYNCRKLFFFDLVLPQHLEEFYKLDDEKTDLLKNIVFDDIENAMNLYLERPEDIGVLLKLSMDNLDETEGVFYISIGL